jgi:GNAT superfamily N-acetyltransferase
MSVDSIVTTVLPIDDVSEAMRLRLTELTLRDGRMAWQLGACYGDDSWIVTAHVEDSQAIAGWALVFRMYGHFNLHVFVDHKCRNRGVGTALVRRAIAETAPLFVVATTNDAARLFFRFRAHLEINAQ